MSSKEFNSNIFLSLKSKVFSCCTQKNKYIKPTLGCDVEIFNVEALQLKPVSPVQSLRKPLQNVMCTVRGLCHQSPDVTAFSSAWSNTSTPSRTQQLILVWSSVHRFKTSPIRPDVTNASLHMLMTNEQEKLHYGDKWWLETFQRNLSLLGKLFISLKQLSQSCEYLYLFTWKGLRNKNHKVCMKFDGLEDKLRWI